MPCATKPAAQRPFRGAAHLPAGDGAPARRVDDATLQAFIAAGFERRHILDVILCLAQKVMSNYTNHVAHTELDARLQPVARQKRAV